MGFFSRKAKVAPAPGPVIASLPKDTVKTLNDAGTKETVAFIRKHPTALGGVDPGRLNGHLEYATEIETASVGGTVVAIRIHKGKKTVVIPAKKKDLFPAKGSGFDVQGGRTQRNRRNRVGRKTRKFTARRR